MQVGTHQCLDATDQEVEHKEEEGVVVMLADAVCNPHTVVVHAQHARFATAAVVAAGGLVRLALAAKARPPILVSRKNEVFEILRYHKKIPNLAVAQQELTLPGS